MKKRKILIVEDTAYILKLSKAIFETNGYDVVTARDGKEGLEVLMNEPVDLVITDILMPNMDGYTLCHKIRHNEKIQFIPVIIYSATYTSHTDESLAMEIGADMFIRKPAAMNVLLEAAANLVERKGSNLGIKGEKAELADVMRQYSSRLIEKLEDKNLELEKVHLELKANEEKYRLLFSSNPMPMWVFEFETYKFLSVNEMACYHYGYSKEEFLSMTLYDIRPEVEKERFAKLRLATEFSPEQLFIGQWKHLKKDGTLIDVEIYAQTILFDNKKARLILSVDITDKKIVERRLENSERRFRALVENSYDAISLLDVNGNIIYHSPAVKQIMGFDLEETRGMNNLSFIHPDDMHLYKNRIEKALKNPGVAIYGSCRMRHKDGHYIWTEGTSTNLLADENVKALVGNFRDITVRKLAEEKLARSERRFRSLVENSFDGISLHDANGNILYVSPATEKILGYTNDEIRGKNGSSFYHIDDIDMVNDRFENVLKNPGQTFYRITRMRHKDGHFVWTEGTTTNMLDDENVGAVVRNFRDITEQKLAKEKIENNEKRFRALVENNTELITLIDENGLIIYNSPSAERMLGYTLEEAVGRPASDFFHPDDIVELEERLEVVLRNPGKPIFRTSRLKHKDGHYIWTEGTTTNLLKDENVRAIVGNLRDISERKLADELIERNEKRFRALVENNFEAIVLLNDQGIVQYASPGTEKIMGMPAEEIVGQPGNMFFHPDEMETVYWRMKSALENPGKPIFTQNRVRHKDGHYIWTEGTTTNFLNDKNVNAFVGNFKDITERKLAEEKIKNSEANLKALFETASDSFILADCDGIILAFNDNARKTTLFTCKDELQVGRNMIDFVEPDRQDLFALKIKTVLDGSPVRYDQSFHDFQGTYHSFDFSLSPVMEDGHVKGICINGREITERKFAEEKLKQANRLYAFVSAINQTIVHVKVEQALFDETCNIAINIGKFKIAWIGMLDTGNRKINVVGCNGMSPEEKMMITNTPYFEDGIHDHVLKTGQWYACNDVKNDEKLNGWAHHLISRGINSCIILPIKKSGYIAGTLNLYSTTLNLFDGDETRMLAEVAADISFALEVFDTETARKKAANELRHNELRLKQAQEIAHIGSWERDMATGQIIFSEEHCRIYGLPTDHNRLTLETWLSYIHPDDVAVVKQKVAEIFEVRKSQAFDHRILLGNGVIKYIHVQAHFDMDDLGNPVSIYGIAHDITSQKEAEEKIININRLYSFKSQINQMIVRCSSEQELFEESCKIALDYGKFAMAWIGRIEMDDEKVYISAQKGLNETDYIVLDGVSFNQLKSVNHILTNSEYYLCNDLDKDYELGRWADFKDGYNLNSIMVLPIWKSGQLFAIFNLFSNEKNFFDSEEIDLLVESTKDIAFALDVFDKDKLRNQMEKKIAHSELRLKQAQEIAHLGSWEVDFSTNTVEWSEEACRIYGLPLDEKIQDPEVILSYIHPDDKENVSKVINEGTLNMKSFRFHHKIIRRDGVERYVFSEGHFEFNDLGIPVGIYGIAHDETETKSAEAALLKSEANLRLIIDLIPQGIFAKDIDGNYLFVNKNFAALYGLTPDQLINQNIISSIPVKGETDLFLQQDQEVIMSGEIKVIPEQSFTDFKGNKLIFYTVKVPYTSAGTNKKAVLGITLDITEQKQTEYEKAKIIDEIVRRNKDLEQFSYIVSHNLRAPVANIMGLTEIMILPGVEMEEIKELMGSLAITVKKLDDVIMDLNYILQLRQGIIEKNELVYFTDMVSDIKLSIGNIIKMENVMILADFHEANEIIAIKSYVYSIFYNLISNSIKYRRKDVQPVIIITSKMHERELELVFKDNGLGIDLDKRGDQVFGLYKRFHTFVEGKGMGLYLVKTQVETMGGKITVESQVNKGTTFRIKFEIDK